MPAATKPLENICLIFPCDTNAGIDNAEGDTAVRMHTPEDIYPAICRRELDRIGQQMTEDLLKGPLISTNSRRIPGGNRQTDLRVCRFRLILLCGRPNEL